MLHENRQIVQQQVTEITGIENPQARLIGLIELLSRPVGEFVLGIFGQLVRRQAAIFPAINQCSQIARRPAFLVDAFGLNQLFQKAQLVIGIENGERGFQLH